MVVIMVMAVPVFVSMMVVVIVGMLMRVRMPVLMFMFMGVFMRGQLRKRLRHHGRVQVATLAGIDLDGRGTGGADTVGVEAGLLVALNHRHCQAGCVLFEGMDGGAQQRGFARTGAGHQVQRTHAMRGKVGAVLRGHSVVGAQHILFDLDGALLAQAGHRHPGRARAKVQVAGGGVNFRT